MLGVKFWMAPSMFNLTALSRIRSIGPRTSQVLVPSCRRLSTTERQTPMVLCQNCSVLVTLLLSENFLQLFQQLPMIKGTTIFNVSSSSLPCVSGEMSGGCLELQLPQGLTKEATECITVGLLLKGIVRLHERFCGDHVPNRHFTCKLNNPTLGEIRAWACMASLTRIADAQTCRSC